MGKTIALNVLEDPRTPEEKDSQVRIIKGGKAEYLKWQKTPDKVLDVCILDRSVDFSLGCIAHVLQEDLESVLNNRGAYPDIDAVRARNNGQDSFGCEWCYARAWNSQQLHTKTIGDRTIESFEELVIDKPRPHQRVIRLGKNTEWGHFYFNDLLKDFLDLCEKYQTRIIGPTRMLKFDRDIAESLKWTKSALLYSIGADKFEKGPVSQGYTQEWKIDTALEYYNAGVNTNLTLTCDMSASIEFNDYNGFAATKAIQAHKRHGIPLRLLALRLAGKEVAHKVTGRTWYDLQRATMFHDRLFTSEQAYRRRGNNELEIVNMHKDWQALYDQFDGSNIGACSKGGCKEYCDHCGLQYGPKKLIPDISFPADQLAERPKKEKKKKKQKVVESYMPLFLQN